MKKNKVISLLLAGSLLVGGTFLGTKALFSDTKTVSNPLVLTTGKVDINVQADEWNHYRNGNYVDSLKYGTEFTNVQPGDSFIKDIIVTNNSTYSVKLAVEKELQNIPDGFEGLIDLTHTVKDDPMSKGSMREIRVEVKIKDVEEAWTALNGDNKLDLDAFYTITATQFE